MAWNYTHRGTLDDGAILRKSSIMEAADPLLSEALSRFADLLARASASPLREPAAVTLATASGGQPSARVVLLRGFDVRGFVFFTNSLSQKGRELAANPRAALCFYWDPLGEQVRVEGGVAPVSAQESDAYWHTRPRDSQLGAWASLQSQPLESREVLERRLREMSDRFEGQSVPRPEHWFGYRLAPERIEFWRTRPARLHDRVLYVLTGGGWKKSLLYP